MDGGCWLYEHFCFDLNGAGVANLTLVMIGAWTIHFVLIIALKIFYDIIPGISQETSWTLTNISYMFGSFLMFHWVRGIPFEFNAGAYDNLNMWEQIDNGDQYTPTKKFLLCVPICLFLLSTHYTHYDLTYFTINFLATLGVVIPKLPFVRTPLDRQCSCSCLANSATVTPIADRSLLRRTGGVVVLSTLFFLFLFFYIFLIIFSTWRPLTFPSLSSNNCFVCQGLPHLKLAETLLL
jgi:hypothetical protein